MKSLWDAGGDVSASVDGTLLSVSEKEPALSLSAAAHQLLQGKKARKPPKQDYYDFLAKGVVPGAGAEGMPCSPVRNPNKASEESVEINQHGCLQHEKLITRISRC